MIKELNMWPTVCKFPIPLIEPLQLLQYSKFQMALVTTNYGQMHGLQMNVLYNGRLGSLPMLKLSTMQAFSVSL